MDLIALKLSVVSSTNCLFHWDGLLITLYLESISHCLFNLFAHIYFFYLIISNSSLFAAKVRHASVLFLSWWLDLYVKPYLHFLCPTTSVYSSQWNIKLHAILYCLQLFHILFNFWASLAQHISNRTIFTYLCPEGSADIKNSYVRTICIFLVKV